MMGVPPRWVHAAAVRLDICWHESLQLVLAPLNCKTRVALETEPDVDLKLPGAVFWRLVESHRVPQTSFTGASGPPLSHASGNFLRRLGEPFQKFTGTRRHLDWVLLVLLVRRECEQAKVRNDCRCPCSFC
jgi:hypothetical protein